MAHLAAAVVRAGTVVGVGLVVGMGAVGTGAPPAQAQPCPDVQVVFARGTGEATGVGGVGLAFVVAVRAQAGGRSVDVYPVDYPAGSNFADGSAFAATVVDGIRDAADHMQAMAADCPGTRMVLGGYSQGAVVAGFVTSAQVPAGIPAESVPRPMPPEVADHVAAVVLFALPSEEFLQQFGAPPVVIGPRYAGKTLQLCAPGDTICSGAAGGGANLAHALYGLDGSVEEAASYAVARL